MLFTLRPATARDAPWLFSIRRATMREYVEEAFGVWDEDAQRRRFDSQREIANIRIVQAGDSDAGLLHVERYAREVFLANIQIDPAFQNRGLGAAVIRDLLEHARREGLPVRLQVLNVNLPARRLYERLGFVVTGEDESHTHMIWRPA